MRVLYTYLSLYLSLSLPLPLHRHKIYILYVCVYIYIMCVCAHTYVYVCMYVCAELCVQNCACTFNIAYISLYIYIDLFIYIYYAKEREWCRNNKDLRHGILRNVAPCTIRWSKMRAKSSQAQQGIQQRSSMSGSLPAARLFDLTKHSEGLKGILPVKCDTGQQQSIWLYMALHHFTSYTYFPEIRFLQVPVRPVCLCRTPVAMPSFMAVWSAQPMSSRNRRISHSTYAFRLSPVIANSIMKCH
jgi:hypothetical protein